MQHPADVHQLPSVEEQVHQVLQSSNGELVLSRFPREFELMFGPNLLAAARGAEPLKKWLDATPGVRVTHIDGPKWMVRTCGPFSVEEPAAAAPPPPTQWAISKEAINALPLRCFGGTVAIVCSAQDEEAALVPLYGQAVLGFDPVRLPLPMPCL